MINPIDREALRRRVRAATPFPHCCLDDFLDEAFAGEVLGAFPTFEEAARVGRTFAAVNEAGKVQVTDARAFPEPVARLNRALADPGFLGLLSDVFGIPGLLADDQLVGGGMHQTGPRGRLDVHVDFNYIEDRRLHRRLNILVYFNKDWPPEWGGATELWDRAVRVRHHAFAPAFNRCVIFETSAISYHGVTAVRCPADRTRKSFAAYYYTKEPPPGWDGRSHSTRFKARPNEVFKGGVLMPLERARRRVAGALRGLKSGLKKAVRG